MLLYNGLKNVADQQEINEGWENVKSAIIVCERNNSITRKEKSPKNEW